MSQTKLKIGSKSKSLLRNLKGLDREQVQVGHFAEQGTHSQTKGMPYSEMMSLFAVGKIADGKKRNPREVLRARASVLVKDPKVRVAIERFLAQGHETSSQAMLLKDLGTYLREEYRSLFGVVGAHMPADSTHTPLKETGELKSEVSYKDSKTNRVHT